MTRIVALRKTMLFMVDLMNQNCLDCRAQFMHHVVTEIENSIRGLKFVVACPDISTPIITVSRDVPEEIEAEIIEEPITDADRELISRITSTDLTEIETRPKFEEPEQ